MNRILAALCAALIAVPALAGPPIKPSTRYPMAAVTIQSPNEKGWQQNGASPGWVVLALTGPAANESTILQARVFKADAPGQSDQTVFDRFYAFVLNHGPKSRFVQLHAERRAQTHKGARCLQYQTVHQDQKMSRQMKAPQYMKVRGYVCRHPADTDILVQLEISNRSGDTVLSAASKATETAFQRAATFTKNGF